METRPEIKYLIDIKDLYVLYTCNIEENVGEKTQLDTQLLKTCVFETLFQSKRSQTCIANQLTDFYAIFNVDKNRLN